MIQNADERRTNQIDMMLENPPREVLSKPVDANEEMDQFRKAMAGMSMG